MNRRLAQLPSPSPYALRARLTLVQAIASAKRGTDDYVISFAQARASARAQARARVARESVAREMRNVTEPGTYANPRFILGCKVRFDRQLAILLHKRNLPASGEYQSRTRCAA